MCLKLKLPFTLIFNFPVAKNTDGKTIVNGGGTK